MVGDVHISHDACSIVVDGIIWSGLTFAAKIMQDYGVPQGRALLVQSLTLWLNRISAYENWASRKESFVLQDVLSWEKKNGMCLYLIEMSEQIHERERERERYNNSFKSQEHHIHLQANNNNKWNSTTAQINGYIVYKSNLMCKGGGCRLAGTKLCIFLFMDVAVKILMATDTDTHRRRT